MSRMLTYADAVRLLGGKDSRLVSALDSASRGLLLGAIPTLPALLGWLGARAEFARLCKELVVGASERRSGLHRLDRTQRLAAAHTVIVVLAFFDELDTLPMPFDLKDAQLTREEQLSIAGGTSQGFVAAILAAGEVIPEPHGSEEDFLGRLAAYYRELSFSVRDFLAGLAVRDRVSQPDWDGFTTRLDTVAPGATVRYRKHRNDLAADFPEVAQWVNAREQEATRAEIRGLVPSFERLEKLLTDIASDGVPEVLRADLARAYHASLDRPVVPADELPAGMRVPTLSAAYVPTLFRVTEASADVAAGDEARWETVTPRDDLDEFLAGFLTSPRATRAPLIILGQPGAGKSMLCRVLAARLPAADFVAVLVSLREVAAADDVQDQIEQAVRAATGRRADWPTLAEAAAGALTVVMLDGFDELLQATGVSQSDYLLRVAQFQQRELDHDRAVAVLVTTRSSVADRARIPPESLLLRLEPFDRQRIAAWLGPWNRVNDNYFQSHRLRPLTPTVLEPYPDLAGQPLLLLMLALYDSDSNALQRESAAALSHGELYERLLRVFAKREVAKHHPDLTRAELDEAVNEELRRLSLVAFAMHNRGRQWITDPELERDLTAILGQADFAPNQLRSRLGQAALMLGRFFFVHRAQAVTDDAVVATYEFLHATFGEYLVARLTWQVLGDTAARSAVSALPFNRADHGFLYALLSFSTLTVRTPIIRFLVGMVASVSAEVRTEYGALLLRLFARAGFPQPRHGFADYEPQTLSVAARQAAYSANLMTLTVVVRGSLRISLLYPDHDEPVSAWHDDCLLWHSQLRDEEWESIIASFAVVRLGSPRRRISGPSPRLRAEPTGDRDIELTIDDGTFEVPAPNLFWSWNMAVPPDYAAFTTGGFMSYLLRRDHIQCGPNDDEIMQSFRPLITSPLAPAVRTHIAWQGPPYRSAAQALLEVWLLPTRAVPPDERRHAYLSCAEIAGHVFSPWGQETRTTYAILLIHAMTVDGAATPDTVLEVLTRITANAGTDMAVAAAIIQCAAAALQRQPIDPRVREGLATFAKVGLPRRSG
jgi:hypothetical protein